MRQRTRSSQLVTVPGLDVSLVVRVNRRARRISLRVDRATGGATLVLPSRRDWNEGLRFVRSQERWLKKQLSRQLGRVPFVGGQVIPYRGEPHEIVNDPEVCGGVWAADGRLIVGGTEAGVGDRLSGWLRHRARTALTDCAEDYATLLRRTIGRVSIRDPKSQWGSCTRSGNLSFSWRLVMAPPKVLDYVAAHEATHLCEFGHGPRFQRLMNDICPHVDWAEAWLAKRGHELHRYG